MHDHFKEGDGGNADGGEVVGVGAPGFGGVDGFLGGRGVGVEGVFGGVDELDGVLELYGRGLVGVLVSGVW